MQEIYKRYATKLGTTEDEIERMIGTILKGENYEDELINLMGYDGFDDIAFVIGNKEKVKNPLPEIEEKERTSIEVRPDYVEIKIPSVSHIKYNSLVNVSRLNEKERAYFKYEMFNPVQSQVFDTAYNTNRNFLVSAPTGCGKTDIALISILRAIKQEGKIVVIVPMKALATEISFKLKNVFVNNKSVKILEFTGDMETDANELNEAKILVATPEKFDVSTRKLNTNFIISLIIIDEIHILHDHRGSVIESIVCRMFRYMEIHQRPVRIIGLSATLPNYADVAKFIKAHDVFYFDPSYRPVPLEMYLIGVRKDENDNFEDVISVKDITENLEKLQVGVSIDLKDIFPKSNSNIIYKNEAKPKKERSIKTKTNEILVEKMTPFLEENQQVLVFVTSRKETERTMQYLENKFLSKRFGIHHAGLPRKLRLENEDRFRNKKIDVLVTTSTLAWGVNLPARCVIIKGTRFYSQESGSFQNIGILDIVQIFGRAGRPQYDDIGHAYLITDNKELNSYYGLIQNRTLVESKLLFHFIDIINTEIYLNNVKNLFEAIQWMKSTFLFIRMLKAPILYGFTKEEIENKEIDKVLADYISIAIRRLFECGLITTDKNLDTNDNVYLMASDNIGIHIHDLTLSYNSTFLGRIASFYFISHETIDLWQKRIVTVYDQMTILEMLFSGTEFNNIILRDEEGHLIQQYCNDLGIDHNETPVCKMLVLFCLYKTGLQTYSMGLTCDQTFMIKNMERLVIGLKEIIIYYKYYKLYDYILEIESIVLSKKIKRTKHFPGETNFILLNDKVYIKSSCSTTVLEVNSEVCEIYYITHDKHFFISKPEIDFKVRNSMVKETGLNHIKTLYKFGLHDCSSTSWTFFGYKMSCPHFNIIYDINEIEDLKEVLTDDILLMEHPDYREFKANMSEEKRSLFFNRKYYIDYEEVDNVEPRERQKLMTRQIVKKIDGDNFLIIVPNMEEVERTANDLNTLLILKSDRMDAYNVVKGFKKDKLCGVVVVDFKEALRNYKKIHADCVILFKGIQGSEIYSFYDILKIVGNNQSTIFETSNIIEFYRCL